MVPLILLILLIVICLIGLSILAAKGTIQLKNDKPNVPQEGRKRPTQALHDVIFGKNDE